MSGVGRWRSRTGGGSPRCDIRASVRTVVSQRNGTQLEFGRVPSRRSPSSRSRLIGVIPPRPGLRRLVVVPVDVAPGQRGNRRDPVGPVAPHRVSMLLGCSYSRRHTAPAPRSCRGSSGSTPNCIGPPAVSVKAIERARSYDLGPDLRLSRARRVFAPRPADRDRPYSSPSSVIPTRFEVLTALVRV